MTKAIFQDKNYSPLYALGALIAGAAICGLIMISALFGSAAQAAEIEFRLNVCAEFSAIEHRTDPHLNANNGIVMDFHADEADEWLKQFNAAEPKSDWKADRVVEWIKYTGEIFQFALFKDGCTALLCREGSKCVQWIQDSKAAQAPADIVYIAADYERQNVNRAKKSNIRGHDEIVKYCARGVLFPCRDYVFNCRQVAGGTRCIGQITVGDRHPEL